MSFDREAFMAACQAADRAAAMHGRVVDNWHWRDGHLTVGTHPKPRRGQTEPEPDDVQASSRGVQATLL